MYKIIKAVTDTIDNTQITQHTERNPEYKSEIFAIHSTENNIPKDVPMMLKHGSKVMFSTATDRLLHQLCKADFHARYVLKNNGKSQGPSP